MLSSVSRRRSPREGVRRPPRIGVLTGLVIPAFCLLVCSVAAAAELADAEKLYRTGRYDECARMADEEINSVGWNEPWRHWKIKSELARGKYADALVSLEDALRRFPASVAVASGWAARSTGRTAATRTPPASWKRSSG